MTTQEKMGYKIKQLREEYGMSQTTLANLVGYKDKTAIAKVEAGKVDLPQSKILAFANALHTTTSNLFEDLEIEKPQNLASHFDCIDHTEEYYNRVFANNLNYYLTLNNKTQLELANYVGVSTASVSNWCKGIKLPRMGKVDIICRYFNIDRSELIEPDGPSIREHRIAEDALLLHYNKLNSKGKDKVIEYASDLSHNILYSNDVLIPDAAHALTKATAEEKQHDEDIMDDENF